MSQNPLRKPMSNAKVMRKPEPRHSVGLPNSELALGRNGAFGDLLSPSTRPKPVHKPFAEAIAAGKNTYVYDAHTYHTKVPPAGITKLIEYYTDPGQTVLDPFCGSGMTGVAATQHQRKALLSDLSPAAVFIARNLNSPHDSVAYMQAVRSLLSCAEALQHKLYDTPCRSCGDRVPILYMVWSYSTKCPHCAHEFILWDVARDERETVRESKILSQFPCPSCNSPLKKRGLPKLALTPVQVGYRCCQKGLKESTAPLCDEDHAVLQRIESEGIPSRLWYPTDAFPEGVNTRQPIAAGITSVDKAYTPRALHAMSFLWDKAKQWANPALRDKLLFTLTSLYQRVTVFSEFRFWGGSGNTANYNVPWIMNEQNVFATFLRKAKTIALYFKSAPETQSPFALSVQSAARLDQIPDKSVDYIFTDPPFGQNINYSEMNFLWESWLQCFTDPTEEAIVNRSQKKGVEEYETLLAAGFRECRRVLKSGAWMTVVFHNSSEHVWTALQRAIEHAGFAIIGTQTFDKRHGTFKQFVSDNAVGYDLVLHCRRRNGNGSVHSNTPDELTEEIRNFVAGALAREPAAYVVNYLHVNREPEIDFRKLYAQWLSTAVKTHQIKTSFEQFRCLAAEQVSEIDVSKYPTKERQL